MIKADRREAARAGLSLRRERSVNMQPSIVSVEDFPKWPSSGVRLGERFVWEFSPQERREQLPAFAIADIDG